jgi:hypothetical protein
VSCCARRAVAYALREVDDGHTVASFPAFCCAKALDIAALAELLSNHVAKRSCAMAVHEKSDLAARIERSVEERVCQRECIIASQATKIDRAVARLNDNFEYSS